MRWHAISGGPGQFKIHLGLLFSAGRRDSFLLLRLGYLLGDACDLAGIAHVFIHGRCRPHHQLGAVRRAAAVHAAGDARAQREPFRQPGGARHCNT